MTVEGVPLELVVAPPGRFGTALLRATGSAAYVGALEPLPEAPDEAAVYERLGIPWCPPELREQPFRDTPPDLLELSEIRGDLHSHTTWSDGRASVEEMGRAASERGYEYLAICDHTPAVGAVKGLTADEVRRQGEEIAAANELLAPFRILRGIECDILPDGRLDLDDETLSELDWVQASVHGGQRMPAREMTKRVEAALQNPFVRCLSHPTGRYINRRPENALDLDRAFELAVEQGVALEVNGLPPRLDLSGEHVRDALRRRRPDRLLDRRPLGRRARQHGVRGADRAPRLGDRRERPQHTSAGLDSRAAPSAPLITRSQTCRSPARASTRRRGRPTGSPATSTSTRSQRRRPARRSPSAVVHFTPGARTAWHTHPHGQTIFVTEGVGCCQREGGPIEVIRPGDRVFFEPGENHWHGAAPNRFMAHVAIQQLDETGSAVTWGRHVSDEEYGQAPS